MEQTVIDPVCGMAVAPDAFALTQAGIRYAFCSQQCRDRFVANTHLYVGTPGHPAAGQAGREVVKRRIFRLEQVPGGPEAEALAAGLRAMMGVKAVHIEADRVALTYDLLQATAEQLEARMAEVGARLGAGWAERLRRGFLHYQEECEIGSLAAGADDGRTCHGR